jgi:hypothetical protein
MPRRTLRSEQASRHHRRHGPALRQPDRRALELDGWRTTLEYRENHRRGRGGRLLGVSAAWHAEAERFPRGARRGERADERGIDVISATADTADGAWSRLRLEAELADAGPVAARPGERAIGPP